jgi:hypothetical protein
MIGNCLVIEALDLSSDTITKWYCRNFEANSLLKGRIDNVIDSGGVENSSQSEIEERWNIFPVRFFYCEFTRMWIWRKVILL